MSRKLVCILLFSVLLGLADNSWAIDKWWNQDVGTTGGSAKEDNGKFTVIGDGGDIWGSADGFQFVYKKLIGEGSITAHVLSQTNTNEWAKAGVMVRETLEPGSKYCIMAITPTAAQGIAFQNRTQTGSGTCYSAHMDPGTINPSLAHGLPYWVRIVREGDQISGYISKDGTNWTLVPAGTGTDASPNPQTNDLTDPVYIGLAVTSHSAGVYGTVEFDNVSCTGNVIDKTPQLKAFKPVPADGTIGAASPLLQWSPGETARLHDIYLGTSPELTAADLAAPRLPVTMFFAGQSFQPGTRYYWRVDEIEKDGTTVHQGDVWSFLTQDTVAYYPTPADQANDVAPGTSLTWMPALAAAQHHLYFGDDLDAVTDAVADVDQGLVEDTTFTPAAALETLKTYYWRVDETIAGAGVKAGPVWSFTTTLPVDDFEAYTDDVGGTVFDAWIDGFADNLSGSMVGYLNPPFTEQRTVHGGRQSMPMDYNNLAAPFYSEATREFETAQDWTVNGADTLMLFIRGRTINVPAPMYLTLEDTSKHAATVVWSDMTMVTMAAWTPWKIPFSQFAGVNMAKVKKLALGVGDRVNPQAGGKGRIFVDDIQVIRP